MKHRSMSPDHMLIDILYRKMCQPVVNQMDDVVIIIEQQPYVFAYFK